MKRRMILIPMLALMMLFAVVTPVMAGPAEKIPVTQTHVQTSLIPGESW